MLVPGSVTIGPGAHNKDVPRSKHQQRTSDTMSSPHDVCTLLTIHGAIPLTTLPIQTYSPSHSEPLPQQPQNPSHCYGMALNPYVIKTLRGSNA
jgi:hypothetical protein